MGSSPTRGDTGGLWSYSVMVITLDSESSDPGSSPGRTSFFHCYVPIILIVTSEFPNGLDRSPKTSGPFQVGPYVPNFGTFSKQKMHLLWGSNPRPLA